MSKFKIKIFRGTLACVYPPPPLKKMGKKQQNIYKIIQGKITTPLRLSLYQQASNDITDRFFCLQISGDLKIKPRKHWSMYCMKSVKNAVLVSAVQVVLIINLP